VGGETPRSLLGAVRDGGIPLGIAGGLSEEEARARGVRTRASRGTRTPTNSRGSPIWSRAGRCVEIAEVLPLTEVTRAHELSEAGHVRGKLVLAMA
jgi:Zinc-binding dehydrogenase